MMSQLPQQVKYSLQHNNKAQYNYRLNVHVLLLNPTILVLKYTSRTSLKPLAVHRHVHVAPLLHASPFPPTSPLPPSQDKIWYETLVTNYVV